MTLYTPRFHFRKIFDTVGVAFLNIFKKKQLENKNTQSWVNKYLYIEWILSTNLKEIHMRLDKKVTNKKWCISKLLMEYLVNMLIVVPYNPLFYIKFIFLTT